ncbi:LURP-one-related family protein [Mobilitalea sibirica]|uniref:LURP-one-related family protein n=1 Tax=Mobilitalea sibirica TaxID=1462919 RepID=A0A8J7H1Y2_9FIRM|nr:LURP-one-related family protein [Mobilitalea sibirica]MBH1940592.1 LURP-one-related family protein [Mobilitalea sibirica]
MKLYIKQRIFSVGDKYDIYDANENVVFDVKSQLFAIGAKLHLYDTQGKELYFIKRKITFLLARYEIYQNDTLCATVSQEFALFKRKLRVESRYGEIQIIGDFFQMDYEITKNGKYFGSIHKKWLSWGDSYELDIPEEEDAGFVCALVIAIDNCMHNENQ